MNLDIRKEIAESWQNLCQLIPEMRAGQLMATVGEVCQDLHGRGLWDATDAELLEAMWHFQRSYLNSVEVAKV